ncbi:MAG: NUDIX hydrolase [Tessaracoccus sp.]|uniref:NUDIX hydrolase n=1 Tax=Tessaracoccus sp. TaxID=1971211 RepID=UPI001EC5F25A|nr:NUDIX domain-containing protein [Tessaracoccus sp.]MBK7821151.1 NUDIX hydrolase [Tessaracoccus sp.]
MTSQNPVRDAAGVALYRHEAIGVVAQVRPVRGTARLCVLLARRESAPYAGRFALPSGPVELDETLRESVRRHLAEKLDLSGVTYLEQLGTSSAPERDPAQRTIATSYLGLVPTDLEPQLPERAAWFDVDALPELAFDHDWVISEALIRLRAKLSYTNLGFALMPAEFTIAELRSVYVAALGHDVAPTNLQRVLARRGQLVPTGTMAGPGAKGGRPARCFRFRDRELVVTDPFAVLRPDA